MSHPGNAREATSAFAKTAVATLGDGPIKLAGDAPGAEVVLPPQVAELVRAMLRAMAEGRDVQLEPTSDEMTPAEAAIYLNVSRPYLVKLLDEGQLPFRMVGTHRRIPTVELIRFKQVTRARQRQGMDAVVRLSEELGLYDDPQPAKTR
jgi:excisionase family DNA binding protein